MAFWKSANFKALKDAWYERLKEDGFQDAEKEVGDSMELKQRSGAPFRHAKSELDRKSKEEYFTLLAQHIHESEFRNDIDQLILTWYANGLKIKEICQQLIALDEYRCRNTIRFTIRRYEARWGIRAYNRRQLNLKN